MKWLLIFTAAAYLTGCATGAGNEASGHRLTPDQLEEANILLATELMDASATAGTVKSHTLFPYHFVESTAVLNELGEREMRILAAHYREHGGPLNLRRDSGAPTLHEERINAMLAFLHKEGVDTSRVRLTETTMGGPGVMSVEAIERMERARESAPETPSGEVEPAIGDVKQ